MAFQTMYKPFEPIPVVKAKGSEVVPDMSFTPREIIAKFSRGERVPLGLEGMFDSADDSEHLFEEHDPEIFTDDPTRDPSFDFGDYVEEKRALEERKKIAKRSKGQQRQLPKRKASAEESSASETMKRETTSEGNGAAPPAQGSQSP